MSEFPVSAKIKATVDRRSVDKLVDSLVDFFSPATETAGLVGDAVRLGRIELAVKITRRAQEIAGDIGREIKAPPLKFLVPFFEKCSIEDEGGDEIHELWSRLLANASTDYVGILSAYIHILGTLSSVEASILSALFTPGNYANHDPCDELVHFPEYRDSRRLHMVVESIKGKSFEGAVLELKKEFDLPGIAVRSFHCDRLEFASYGLDRGSGGHEPNLNLPNNLDDYSIIIEAFSLLQAKGLIQECKYIVQLKEGEATLEAYVSTPLGINFMNSVSPCSL